MDQSREDVRDVPGPGLPVLPVSALVDDPGEDGAGRQVDRRERQLGAGWSSVSASVAAAEDDAAGGRVVEVDLVDLGVEPVVVRTQRAQDVPDHAEAFVVVQRRNVDPLGQAARVREDAARAPGAAPGVALALQPLDPGLAVERVMLAVDVPRGATERAPAFGLRQQVDGVADDVVPMRFQALRRGDGVGERDGAGETAHGLDAGGLVLRILQRAPAAGDLRGVGQVDLALAPRQMRLQRGVDVLLGHGEHDDLVVRQQPLIDGPGEGQAVELRSVGLRIVHREHVDVVARRLRLGALRVEARRRRHVETPGGPDPLPVVDEHERGGSVAGPLDAGGPVGFIAEDEVEGRRSLVLRPLHDAERVVGAEDHRQRVFSGLPERRGDRRRVRGDGDFELLERGVLVVAPRPGVGADAHVAVGYRALRRPLPHRLGEQGDRRHEVQHPAAGARHGFRDAQRGEGLAGAAGHDELAAIVVPEAGEHVVERGLLVGPQTEGLAAEGEVFRLAVREVGPIERSAGEVAEAEHGAGGLQMLDGPAGVRPPAVAGVHDDAGGERVAGRRGDEGVEMRLRDLRARRVTLALDGATAAPALLGDEVDARIGAVEVRPRGGPLGPEPDVGETLPVERVLEEVRLHQPLEETPLLCLGACDGPDVVQGPLEAAAQCHLLALQDAAIVV